MWADQLAGERAGDHSGQAKAIAQIVVSIGAIIGCVMRPVVGGKFGRRPVYFGLCLLRLSAASSCSACFDTYNVVHR